MIPAQPENACLGSVSQDFNGSPLSYTNQEILNMVVFYNEDFYILPGDDIVLQPQTIPMFIPIYSDVVPDFCTTFPTFRPSESFAKSSD
jgi:hypothetical protein